MKLACLLLRHRPMLSSIMLRDGRFTALCDRCGLPIERPEGGRWKGCEPLSTDAERAA